MSLPTYHTVSATIPYTATDAGGIEAVRSLATLLGNLPGLVFDDTQTIINGNYYCKAYVCNATTLEKVICVTNNSASGKSFWVLGWFLVNSLGEPFLEVSDIYSSTGGGNDSRGTYWDRYATGQRATLFTLHYATLSTGVTVFDLFADKSPLTSSSLANFITTVSQDGVVIAQTVGRVYEGCYTLSLYPGALHTYIGVSLEGRTFPRFFGAGNGYFNSPLFYIGSTNVKIDNLGVFSGFRDTSRGIYKVFTADDNISRIVIGGASNNSLDWEPCFVV